MRLKTLTALAVICLAAVVHAQDYPNQPITMVVTAPAGGAADVIARVLADEMAKSMKQPPS